MGKMADVDEGRDAQAEANLMAMSTWLSLEQSTVEMTSYIKAIYYFEKQRYSKKLRTPLNPMVLSFPFEAYMVTLHLLASGSYFV